MEKRKNAHLTEFKLNEEQQFKLRNLTNKKLAAWVADTCSLSKEQQDSLTLDLIKQDIVQTGQGLVIKTALEVLKNHGQSFSHEDINLKIKTISSQIAQELQIQSS